jgi:hypothetical protein
LRIGDRSGLLKLQETERTNFFLVSGQFTDRP